MRGFFLKRRKEAINCDAGEDAQVKIGFFERLFPTIGGPLKFFLAAVSILVIAFLVAVVTLNIVGSRRLRDARARAAEAMVPLTSEAFYLKYPQPRDEENAANYYKAAFLVLATTGRNRPGDLARKENGAPQTATAAVAPEYLEAVRQTVSDYRLVLELLCEGAKLPACSYDVEFDNPGASISHLSDARTCTRLLSLAVLLAAEDGRGGDGIAHARAGLALARSFEKEPLIISGYVGMAIASLTLSGNFERLLSFTEVSDEDLAALQQDLERYAAEYSVFPMLEGELVRVCAINEMLQTNRLTPQAAFDTNAGGAQGTAARMPSWVMRGYFKCDQAYAISAFLKTLADIRAASARSLSAVNAPEPGIFMVSQMLLPAISRVYPESESARTRLRAAAAAIAALRFRKANGRWPDGLSELAGSYIETPSDVSENQGPISYDVLDDGIDVGNGLFRIWDRMPEKQDEGGE